MAGETVSGSLSIIVDDLRKKSVTKSLQMGVVKNLVTVYNQQGGHQISLPIWDATSGGSASIMAEAGDYNGFAQYKNTSWTLTASKRVFGTRLTDEDKWYASESIRDAHAEKHAYAQAIKMESALNACYASFSSSVTATSTSGLSVSKLMDAVATLEGTAYDMTRPYSFVTNAFGYNYLAKDMAQQGLSSNYGPVGPLAEKTLNNYFVTSVMGCVNVFQTPIGALAATTICNGGLFSKDAIGLFVPVFYEFETERNASAGTTELISRAVYGARVRFATYGVKVVHRAK